jgi:hypothetical protein
MRNERKRPRFGHEADAKREAESVGRCCVRRWRMGNSSRQGSRGARSSEIGRSRHAPGKGNADQSQPCSLSGELSPLRKAPGAHREPGRETRPLRGREFTYSGSPGRSGDRMDVRSSVDGRVLLTRSRDSESMMTFVGTCQGTGREPRQYDGRAAATLRCTRADRTCGELKTHAGTAKKLRSPWQDCGASRRFCRGGERR